jgi:hypothetical protein
MNLHRLQHRPSSANRSLAGSIYDYEYYDTDLNAFLFQRSTAKVLPPNKTTECTLARASETERVKD